MRLPFLAFRSAVPKHGLPSAVSDRLPSDLLTARHSLHLRFARFRPKPSWGVFSDTAAGIAARSVRYVFPFRFSGFPLHLQVRFHRLDELKLRLQTESRKAAQTELSTDALL